MPNFLNSIVVNKPSERLQKMIKLGAGISKPSTHSYVLSEKFGRYYGDWPRESNIKIDEQGLPEGEKFLESSMSPLRKNPDE